MENKLILYRKEKTSFEKSIEEMARFYNDVELTPEKDWEKEREKCLASPYYYYTNYYLIDGKPATTALNEEEFNKMVADTVKMTGLPFFIKLR